MSAAFFIACALGLSVRLSLYKSSVCEWMASRPEVITPSTSWNRVTEGMALRKMGVSPYDGDILHQTPLMMRFLERLSSTFGEKSIHIPFISCDILTAVVLHATARALIKYIMHNQPQKESELKLQTKDFRLTGLIVAVAYLFNPYTIATCLAKSTSVFDNLLLATALLFTVKGKRSMATLFIAASAYQTLYPIMLVVPAAMLFAQKDSNTKGNDKKSPVVSYMKTAYIFVIWLAALPFLSHYLERSSWAFIRSTYGFILTVPDLTPNIGVFWYFFTEMFEHFRLFFICVFQINAFLYTVPLAIRLQKHPVFFLYILLPIIAVFKSYPSYADTIIYIALLPVWAHTYKYMRNTFVVTVMYIVCSVVAPILWHLWIYAGSANANFYFAITLVYSTAQIFLMTDLLFAFLRRDYDVIHGTNQLQADGKPAKIILD
ncbi:unnamed protein product [Owenia fusiformis]|uniref:Uncharacterized protein n=1 Tax=Owenia fusiformis TaxID=6347 RepID=A0A8J1TJM9_OWEFU|nr:unnamed protein product [Owenia fusiformis]